MSQAQAKPNEKDGAYGTRKDSQFNILYEQLYKPAMASIVQLEHLFPDSVLFGSLILYLITQSVSYGVLAIFFLETSLLHKVIAFVCEKTVGHQGPNSSKPKEDILRCRPGFKASRKEWERVFSSDKYPSISMFYWGSLVAYISGANYSFAQVLQSMGAEWCPRIIFSVVGIIILTILFSVARMGCDSFTEIMLAFGLGAICGLALYFINLNLFGLEAMNFNGLPTLVNKTEMGSSIYVCAPPQIP
jgi:hypothetical protein